MRAYRSAPHLRSPFRRRRRPKPRRGASHLIAATPNPWLAPRVPSLDSARRGYNIGIRLVDEFCARARVVRCKSFKETMETVARDGFKMFLGVQGVVDGWSPDGASCSIRLPDNPLADFVELPPAYAELRYSNLICGVIRGSLEMLSMRVEAHFAKDALSGDDATEIRVQLKEVLGEAAGKDYKED